MAEAEAAKSEGGPSKRRFISRGEEATATGVKPPNGVVLSFMHMVKVFVGTGIFALGKAFQYTGWGFGIVLMALLALLNLHCQHLLLNAADEIAELETDEVHPSFAETVEYSLELSSNKWLAKHSRKFGAATNVFLMMAEFGFCSVYFVFIASHIVEITSSHGFLKMHDLHSTQIMLAIVLLPMWLSTFLGSLKLLAPLSIIANVVTWCGVGLVMYYMLKDGAPKGPRDFITNCANLHQFFGISLFSFEGVTFVIPLRNEMKEPKKFNTLFGVLNSSMIFITVLYCMVGGLAYWKYGNKVESSVFLNLPAKEIKTQVAQGLICVAVMLTFTVHMYIPFEVTYPLFYRKYGPFKRNWLVMAIYRSVPVLLTFTCANVVPFLGLFIGLIGSATGAILAILLPPILELCLFKLKPRKYGTAIIVKDVIIIIIGVIAFIGGTIMSVMDIVVAFINQSKK